MHPMGWKHMSVPSREPISETSESKTGMALAMMYAITVTPKVQLSQVIQCVGELLARCLVPWRMWMKMYFAGNYMCVSRWKVLACVSMHVLLCELYVCDYRRCDD